LRNTNIGEKVLTGSQGERAEHMTLERMHFYAQTFFTCDTKWRSKLTVEKCCQVPRCKCCTADGYAGIRKDYDS
jgi:hypothetical protein